MAVQNYYNAWVDAFGQYIQTVYYWDPGGPIGAPEGLGVFLTDLSNAGLSYYAHAERQFDETTEGANALYPSVTQLAQLVFSDDAGSTAVITVPAPKSSMFLADGITVNSGQFDVALLISTCILSYRLYTAAGNLVTTYVRGFRTGRGA